MKRILICLSILLMFSCSKTEKSNIPYAPVYFKVDLQFKDKDLIGALRYKEFTTARNYGEKVGFSGILVVCGYDNSTYYAYDLCCPNEGQQNIKITPSDDGTARCLKCGIKFDIGSGLGNVLEGSTTPMLLRSFNVTNKGQELIIQY